MKNLLKIALGGFLVFMAIAIPEEWGYFSSAWFGGDDGMAAITDDDRTAAVDAVGSTLTLLGHLYRSGGDSRFVERIPATGTVVSEFTDDIEYLRRNHRAQDPTLQRLEIVSVQPAGPDRVEVATREYWIHRVHWIGSMEESEPARSQVLAARYLVARDGRRWIVEGWRPDEATP